MHRCSVPKRFRPVAIPHSLWERYRPVATLCSLPKQFRLVATPRSLWEQSRPVATPCSLWERYRPVATPRSLLEQYRPAAIPQFRLVAIRSPKPAGHARSTGSIGERYARSVPI
jgi:hypothetical protein